VTGDEWLEQVLERGLRIGDPAAYPELLGALRALRACGVLSEERAREAEERLNTRFDRPAPTPPDPSLPDVRAPATGAVAAHDVLEAVLAPAEELVDVDGITVILVSVELWTNGLFVRLAGLRTDLTDELDASFEGAMTHWAVAAREAKQTGAKLPPPHQPGERLMRLPLTVSDDVGTTYRSLARSAGGTGTEWRSEWRFEPGVPRAATRLIVAVDGSDGRRHARELSLPAAR
jgi:hypothetical protein